MRLRDYQQEAKRLVYEQWAAHDSTLAVLATGLGKAQPLSANVLTPEGFVCMADIRVGAKVIGSDGLPHSVAGVFPQGVKQVYRVTCSDGASARCCGEHLWAVQTKSQKSRGGGFRVVELQSIADDLRDGSGAWKWFLPVVQPVAFDTGDPLPLDPYLVGVLIGDGAIKYHVGFSSADQWIVDRVRDAVADLARVVPAGGCDYRISGARVGRGGSVLYSRLERMGLLRKGSPEKSIPSIYLRAGVADRLALLRGLMDTDGTAAKDGHAEFNTTSPRLAYDVVDLVRSLGGCTRARRRPASHYTHKGEFRTGLPSYRVTVTLNGINPFSLPRKAERVNLDKNQGQTRAIVAVEPEDREQCQCIAVDAPDRLYVTDDYIVTHNTVLFAHVAHEAPGRVLVMAHRDELIAQAAQKIERITGDRPAVEKGEDYSDETAAIGRAKVVVTSVQTMSRPRRLARFDPGDYCRLITDEAHHATAPSYKRVYAHFGQNKALRHLGVTATPQRADEAALGQVYRSVACNYDIRWGVDNGWLCPVRQRVCVVDDLDFSKIKTIAGDFAKAELEEILAQESILHAMAAPTVEMAGDRPTLFFTVGKKQAHLIAAVLNRYKGRSAEAVTEDTPQDARRDIVRRYKAGDLQFLVNCGVFTEGFDAPDTSLVVMGRPTKSIVVYTQCLGRVTRPPEGCVDGIGTAEGRRAAILASGKIATVLDFVGNHQRHAQKSTITAVDIFGGKWGQEVRQYAKRTLEEEGSAAGTDDALDRADAELALLAEEEERRKRIVARAKYRVEDFHAEGGVADREQREEAHAGEGATPKQIGLLVNLGIPRETARQWTKRQASAVIGKKLAERKGEAA